MIKANDLSFPVAMMYRLLPVSCGGYYAWKHGPPSIREQSNQRLAVEVKRVFDDTRRARVKKDGLGHPQDSPRFIKGR